ncbi:MAG: dihydrolipoyllysine-residue acetyltransferase [Arenicella sp.]
MIRFVEITPPAEAIFRQAKIVSIDVAEGDTVQAGQSLFTVISGKQKHPLPAPSDGRIAEIIVTLGETIHASSSILLLEMEVPDRPRETAESLQSNDAEKTVTASPEPTPATASGQNKSTEDSGDSAESTNKEKRHKKKDKNNRKAVKGDADKQQQFNFDQLTALDADSSHTELLSTRESNSILEPLKAHKIDKREKTAMSEIIVPDLGGDTEVEVIDILVNVGDNVSLDDSLITVESDKASMDIPSTASGTIEEILVNTGDKVVSGAVIIKLKGQAEQEAAQAAPAPVETATEQTQKPAAKEAAAVPSSSSVTEVKVPDLGASDVDVIDILVAVGDTINLDDPLITVETDKASMDVPSSAAGEITSVEVVTGSKVNEGDVIITLKGNDATNTPAAVKSTPSPKAEAPAPTQKQATVAAPKPNPPAEQPNPTPQGESHASPSIRRFARELGVDLSVITGSARKGRITKSDVKAYVKSLLQSGAGNNNAAPTTSGSGIPEIPNIDFSKFGETEVIPLNKIKRLTAENTHRSWLNVPHVTHNDECDISDLESFRKEMNVDLAKRDIKLSPLAFIVKACAKALKTFPQFNSSLENGGQNLIMKKYCNIGIAVDTPNGLVVPIIKDADQKSITEIAQEMSELAAKARDKKLAISDMQGGTFTISSLGGIGGTGFTPIVNAPEVAILGVARTQLKPAWNGAEFVPAKMLPLCLSYDHRVIDGAEGARFARFVAECLQDVRKLLV